MSVRDCSGCNVTMVWRGDEPLADEDALCDACVWDEVRALRLRVRRLWGALDWCRRRIGRWRSGSDGLPTPAEFHEDLDQHIRAALAVLDSAASDAKKVAK